MGKVQCPGYLYLIVPLSLVVIPVSGCSGFLLTTTGIGEIIIGRTFHLFEREGVKGSFMVEIQGHCT